MTDGPIAALRGLWPFIAVAALLFCLGLGVTHFDGFSRFRHYVGNQAVPERLARLGRSGKALKLLDYNTLGGTRLEGFDNSIVPKDMPSTTILSPELVSGGVSILSLVVDSKDLLDRDSGILVNPTKKGRSWERPAYATFFEDGEIQFATGAGVRVHGGKSRLAKQKSFQLHFRELYGEANAPFALVGGESDDRISSLVVHSSLSGGKNGQFHYVNPVAYEVARRIGCIVPIWTPVQLYLNGVYQGPYVLTERIDEDFFATHYGHTNFVIFDTKGSELKQGSRRDIADLLSWSNIDSVPASMAEMNEKVDLANLTNWYLSIIYAGTTDPYQGIAARDKTREDSRWFWINWDMDHSFVDIYAQVEHPWEIDTIGNLNKPEARSVIFKRLMKESPEYRKYFLSRLTEVLNHDLNQEYMDDLISRYQLTAVSMGFERTYLLQSLSEYAKHRPAVLRQQATQYLSAGPSYYLSVTGPASVSLKVDGRKVGARYRGWYFADTPARIELEAGSDSQKFDWVIDGKMEKSAERALTVDLSSDTTVEVVPAS